MNKWENDDRSWMEAGEIVWAIVVWGLSDTKSDYV